jgi:hypothetical protein
MSPRRVWLRPLAVPRPPRARCAHRNRFGELRQSPSIKIRRALTRERLGDWRRIGPEFRDFRLSAAVWISSRRDQRPLGLVSWLARIGHLCCAVGIPGGSAGCADGNGSWDDDPGSIAGQHPFPAVEPTHAVAASRRRESPFSTVRLAEKWMHALTILDRQDRWPLVSPRRIGYLEPPCVNVP